MRRFARAVVAVTLLLAANACDADDPGGRRFFAVMTGDIVMPPVGTPASGNADFTARGTLIEYSVVGHNIVGVTRVSIHAGAGGVNGPVVADLFTGPTTGPITSAVIVAGTLNAAAIAGMTPDSLLSLMATGKAYVQVNTTSRPAGEVRGQVNAN